MIPVELDVCDPGSVRKAVETVAEVAPDGLDVLINNAGYALTGPAETLATDDVRAQFETNVIGLFDVTRAFLPQMRARRTGRIVNISSLLGEISVPGSGIYGGTKHAVEALSDALRMELRQFGISVVVVQPGFTSTEIDLTGTMATKGGTIADYGPLERDLTTYLEAQTKAGVTPEVVAACVAARVSRHARRRAMSRRRAMPWSCACSRRSPLDSPTPSSCDSSAPPHELCEATRLGTVSCIMQLVPGR